MMMIVNRENNNEKFSRKKKEIFPEVIEKRIETHRYHR